MKVKTWVEFSEEVEVEVSVEDMVAAFSDFPEPNETWLRIINRLASLLNRLPDDEIAKWKLTHQELIADFLMKQATRFEAIVFETKELRQSERTYSYQCPLCGQVETMNVHAAQGWHTHDGKQVELVEVTDMESTP